MKFLAALTLGFVSISAGNELAESPFRFDFQPSIETVVWSGDSPPPALQGYDENTFLAPRLALALNATAGDHWFFHATTRWDRGFDAGDEPDGDVRLDEIMLRWRVCDDQRLNFQIGKFPSVFGAWSAQHDFFDDPFLLAPLPYSQIIGINTRNPAAISPSANSARADGLSPALSTLPKDQWTSILWGPGYASGGSVFGATEHLDYALEIKNSALSSHPDSWSEIDFSDPTVTARFGYRPDAAWAFGVSASSGPWMEDGASGLLPAGDEPDDFLQQTLGLDARWAHHNLVLSGEVVISEFETPASGDLRAASWFLQARWVVSPGFWLATRFGQTMANDAENPAGDDIAWQPDVWRAEIGAGWRITPDLLLKAGYSFTHTDGDRDAGENLLGTGIGWRF